MTHWQRYPVDWSKLVPPLRPDAQIIAKVKSLTGQVAGPVLLLGVTPELAQAFEHVLGVDKNKAMIDRTWPGDTATRKTLHADWLDLSEPKAHFAAAVGDGSLNAVGSLRETRLLLERVVDLLAPGGRFACRLYERPVMPFTKEHLLELGSGRGKLNFHAFKWKLAMHLAEEVGASMPVVLIRERFNELFPDRDKLARETGWPRELIDMIDIYRGSPTLYVFPNRQEFLGVMPKGIANVRFEASGSYDLAECCPMLAFEKIRAP